MNKEAKLILTQVCQALNISETDVLSKSRLRERVEARFLCMYFFRTHISDASMVIIGKWLSCDHSSVVYGVSQTRALREFNPSFKEKYSKCLNAMAFYNKQCDFTNIPQL